MQSARERQRNWSGFNYTFIWGMVGENQAFTDMDHVPMEQLK